MNNEETEVKSPTNNGDKISKEDFAKIIGAKVDQKTGWIVIPISEVST